MGPLFTHVRKKYHERKKKNKDFAVLYPKISRYFFFVFCLSAGISSLNGILLNLQSIIQTSCQIFDCMNQSKMFWLADYAKKVLILDNAYYISNYLSYFPDSGPK